MGGATIHSAGKASGSSPNRFQATETSQATSAEQEQFGALLIGTEKVAQLVSRCSVYEIVLQSNGSIDDPDRKALHNFNEALTSLYEAILSFLSEALRIYDQSIPSRVFSAVVNPSSISDFLKRCDPLERQVELEYGNCHRLYLNSQLRNLDQTSSKLLVILSDMQRPLVRTDERLSAMWQHSSQDRRKSIIMWMSDISQGNNHFSARYERTEGTGEWLLEHRTFKEWQDSSASMILWLHGIRKSSLTFWLAY